MGTFVATVERRRSRTKLCDITQCIPMPEPGKTGAPEKSKLRSIPCDSHGRSARRTLFLKKNEETAAERKKWQNERCLEQADITEDVMMRSVEIRMQEKARAKLFPRRRERASRQRMVPCKSAFPKNWSGKHRPSVGEVAAASSSAVDARRGSGSTQTQCGWSVASTSRSGGVGCQGQQLGHQSWSGSASEESAKKLSSMREMDRRAGDCTTQ